MELLIIWCSWSIAYRRCSNYIVILDYTPSFSGLGKHNYRTRNVSIWNLVRLTLEVWQWYLIGGKASQFDIKESTKIGQATTIVVSFESTVLQLFSWIYHSANRNTHSNVSDSCPPTALILIAVEDRQWSKQSCSNQVNLFANVVEQDS